MNKQTKNILIGAIIFFALLFIAYNQNFFSVGYNVYESHFGRLKASFYDLNNSYSYSCESTYRGINIGQYDGERFIQNLSVGYACESSMSKNIVYPQCWGILVGERPITFNDHVYTVENLVDINGLKVESNACPLGCKANLCLTPEIAKFLDDNQVSEKLDDIVRQQKFLEFTLNEKAQIIEALAKDINEQTSTIAQLQLTTQEKAQIIKSLTSNIEDQAKMINCKSLNSYFLLFYCQT